MAPKSIVCFLGLVCLISFSNAHRVLKFEDPKNNDKPMGQGYGEGIGIGTGNGAGAGFGEGYGSGSGGQGFGEGYGSGSGRGHGEGYGRGSRGGEGVGIGIGGGSTSNGCGPANGPYVGGPGSKGGSGIGIGIGKGGDGDDEWIPIPGVGCGGCGSEGGGYLHPVGHGEEGESSLMQAGHKKPTQHEELMPTTTKVGGQSKSMTPDSAAKAANEAHHGSAAEIHH